VTLKIFFYCWIKRLYSGFSFAGVDVALKSQNIFCVAEAFGFAVWTLSANTDAVVYHAVGYTRGTVNTQIIYDANFSSFPVQRIGGAGFHAQIAFYSPAGSHVNADASFLEAIFDAHRLQKLSPTALRFLLFFFRCFFREEIKNVHALLIIFSGHFSLSPLALVFRDVLFLQNITYISWLITECIFLWTPDYRFSLAFSGSTTQVTTINSKKRGAPFLSLFAF
jgi:hypothetical protein